MIFDIQHVLEALLRMFLGQTVFYLMQKAKYPFFSILNSRL